MKKIRHSIPTTLPRRAKMEDVLGRPGARWEQLVTRSSWTLRGGKPVYAYTLFRGSPRLGYGARMVTARARRSLLR